MSELEDAKPKTSKQLDDDIRWTWSALAKKRYFRVVFYWAWRVVLPITVIVLGASLKSKSSECDKLHEERTLLVQTNLFLQTQLTPVISKAKELYPEFDNAAALSKLVSDMQEVRHLATRGDFIPLSPPLRTNAIAKLNRFHQMYRQIANIDICVEAGGPAARSRVAKQLAELLNSVGIRNRLFVTQGITLTIDQPLRVQCDEVHQREAIALAGAFSGIINADFLTDTNTLKATSGLVFQLVGDPIFAPNGMIGFK